MLEFEKAGQLRDQIIELRKIMEGDPADLVRHVVNIDGAAKQPNGNGRADKAGKKKELNTDEKKAEKTRKKKERKTKTKKKI